MQTLDKLATCLGDQNPHVVEAAVSLNLQRMTRMMRNDNKTL